jgi:RNA polymerase sigma-70 factor, ECF subfamily
MGKIALSEVAPIAREPAVVNGNLGLLVSATRGPAQAVVAPNGRADLEIGQPTFEQIFRLYAPYVLRALVYLGVAESDIEDLCQDVFTTVYQNLAKFEGRSSVRTWIYGICINKVLNYRRVAYRRRERLGENSEPSVESHLVGQLEKKQACDLLQRALDELDQQKREAFVLYEIEELSMAEVARAVGCPLFTAYSRLYAARRQVKKRVEQFHQDKDALRSTGR